MAIGSQTVRVLVEYDSRPLASADSLAMARFGGRDLGSPLRKLLVANIPDEDLPAAGSWSGVRRIRVYTIRCGMGNSGSGLDRARRSRGRNP